MEKETVTTNVRDIPREVYEALRKDAEENRRTMNSEILYVLEQWAKTQRS